jgi:hypothetical protein
VLVDTAELASLFHTDYHSDRAAFERVALRFASQTARHLLLHRHIVDEADDLCVTAAELQVECPSQLVVLVTGIHGIEGYTGSAVVRWLLSELLLGLDAKRTGLLVIHALNPYGFAHFLRVNRRNVDLNRNCARSDDELLRTDSRAYTALPAVLSPRQAADVRAVPRMKFFGRMLAARAQMGESALRQATLAGQYVDPHGVFWGGNVVQPELRFFQRLYERLAAQYSELLLIDLHTGYGERGQTYALFGRADTPGIAACSAVGVRDGAGREATYEVFGDLVQYCQQTAKRLQPTGIFDGVALEVGTHGLSVLQQLQDLYTVVQENQARHYGVGGARSDSSVRTAFRELFYPSDSAWRARALRSSVRAVDGVLRARKLLCRQSA